MMTEVGGKLFFLRNKEKVSNNIKCIQPPKSKTQDNKKTTASRKKLFWLPEMLERMRESKTKKGT